MSAAATLDVDPAAFELGPRDGGKGRASVLCLHGLTGTPYEVRSVAALLAARDIYCRGPALPGHNVTPGDLARTSWVDWLDCARSEVLALRERGGPVFAVGMSMGGLVSLSLAAEGVVDAVAVAGTPLALRQPIPLLVPWVKYLLPYRRKSGGSDIRDAVARARHPGYDVMPLASVHELLRLQAYVSRRLADVSVPLLVAHGALDRTADPLDAQRILDSVSASERELHLYERSGHVVTVDHDGPQLASAVADFFERQIV
jgi:carboxylesterase